MESSFFQIFLPVLIGLYQARRELTSFEMKFSPAGLPE
ncbi:hypothetical protein DCCM_2986 [Desulfocucumis palustris]|uniref:Uncharacterized protein n=1 Tax=Desulfocucumis palustris TaxID=1898651 RepID=A0A2L2XCB5_9FIRM|nr:hypothetical protein DCCM_2986 [Desulfocucumis palustris]